MNQYQRAFEKFERWENNRPNYVRALQALANVEAETEHKRLFGKKRKYKYANLPQEYRDALYTKYTALLKAKYDLREKQKARWDKILNALAPECDLTPQQEHIEVAESHSSTYSTQGFGANTYARGALANKLALLQANGFDAKICSKNGYRSGGDYPMWYEDYAIVANAAKWQYDAVMRKPMTLKEWVANLEKAGVNPRVYNPFLPYGTLSYEK